MARRIGILLIVLITTVSFLYVAYAQMAEKGWEKTVTLPSGEVILDMSGEWDSLYEFYGILSYLKPVTDILTITQEGNTFTAVKQIGSEYVPKGAETIKGIMDKDGFKEIQIYRMEVWAPCTCEISENGNKIVVSDGRVIQGTLTRK
jgi:hypothetical protein